LAYLKVSYQIRQHRNLLADDILRFKQIDNLIDDTAEFYRFFDTTPHAEFLFGCIARTIEKDLPQVRFRT
jgi:hypothetical protein